MLVSMTILALSTYALLLLNPAARYREGVGSVDGFNSLIDSTWSEAQLNGDCTEAEKGSIWDSLPRCQPRNILVTIPFPPDPDLIQFIPNQVEVPRCAGTCYQDGQLYHRCSANETAWKEIPVILERIAGASALEVCTTVKVEVHISCKCGCGEEACTPLQEFSNKTCSCRCRDTGAMGQCLVQPNKIWDADRCNCRCRAEEWKECTTGFSYDGVYTCQCLPGPPISASTGVTVSLAVLVVLLSVCVAGLLVLYRRSTTQLRKANRSQFRSLRYSDDKTAKSGSTDPEDNADLPLKT